MALVHHNKNRVNAEVPDAHVEILRESGWAKGLHKDTDPDDDSAVPRVLPAEDDDDEDDGEEPAKPTKATKATDKKG